LYIIDGLSFVWGKLGILHSEYFVRNSAIEPAGMFTFSRNKHQSGQRSRITNVCPQKLNPYIQPID